MFHPFPKQSKYAVTVDTVKNALDNAETMIILDVRSFEEYAKGHVAGSINLAHIHIAKNIATIVPDKNALIYVYCLSGSRSILAVEQLRKLGYTKVYNMTSGILAWRQRGYPLVVWNNS